MSAIVAVDSAPFGSTAPDAPWHALWIASGMSKQSASVRVQNELWAIVVNRRRVEGPMSYANALAMRAGLLAIPSVQDLEIVNLTEAAHQLVSRAKTKPARSAGRSVSQALL